MKIVEMVRQRRRRAALYSIAEYWDTKAEHFDGAAVSMWPNNHLNALYQRDQLEVLDRVLGGVRGRDILDVGCDIGRMSRHLAGRSARVTAFDFRRTPLPIEITDQAAATLVRLPLWAGLAEQAAERVLEGVTSYR